jgi:hypothetical protein
VAQTCFHAEAEVCAAVAQTDLYRCYTGRNATPTTSSTSWDRPACLTRHRAAAVRVRTRSPIGTLVCHPGTLALHPPRLRTTDDDTQAVPASRHRAGAALTSAASITVRETVELLETGFAAFAEGLANGRYVLWLGSGISRDRLPNLRSLALKVLEFLHARMLGAADGEPYRLALEKALGLGLRRHEAERVDVDQPIGSWPGIDDLLDGLVERYSDLLGIDVGGEEPDFLLWEAVDVRATYGPGHAPDCEHLCVAMLALEGAITEAASANWDGLIEAAFAELGVDASDFVRVIVLPDDLRDAARPLTLVKFHGCAVRAAEDPPSYRPALVATRKQITKWIASDGTRVIRRELTQLATTRPTLVVGLSAQDENIQQLFAKAANAMRWSWPSDPPAHVIAGGAIGDDHLNILRVVYGEEKAAEIEEEVLIPAYAKAFLTALVLAVLTRKLCAYLGEAHAPQLQEDEREQLAQGLGALARRLADAAGPDRLAFTQRVAAGQGRTLALFRDPTAPIPAGPAAFQPLSGLPPERVKTDPGLATGGLPELAAAVALLGRGAEAGTWTLEATGDAPVKVSGGAGEAEVFFAANGRSATGLVAGGLVDPAAAEAVIIHSTEPVAPAARSPRGRYGRTGRTGMREVDMCELLKTSADLAALEDGFRQAAGL